MDPRGSASITIVDYGMGNMGSIVNMLKKVGTSANVTSDPGGVLNAKKLIFPGVGSWDEGVRHLREGHLSEALRKAVLERRVPVLGICLGMQLLFERSEEGTLPGLGWFKGRVVRFRFPAVEKLKVPHMGWNTVNIKSPSVLFAQPTDEERFYFVHSFHASDVASENVLTTTRYGYDFVSSVHCKNIYGVQYHPEKSHKYGMHLLKNFSELT